jgi:hypothetical protein
MVSLTLGGDHGAATEDGRQEEERGDNAQGKPYKKPEFNYTVSKSSKQ